MPRHTIHNERPEIQDRMIKLFQRLGYEYVSRSDAEIKRKTKRRVIFEDELSKFLLKHRFRYDGQQLQFSVESIKKAINDLDMPIQNGLMLTNKKLYDLICMGKSLEQTLPNGSKQSFDIDYVDFVNPERNTFQVTDEFEVERTNGKFARPDIVLLVNGIPLVVIECKKSSVDVKEGIKQNIRNWHPDYIPNFFKYIQLVIAANPHTAKYGTCGTPEQFFVAWKENDKQWLNAQYDMCNIEGNMQEQDRLTISMLSKKRLLDLIKNFIIYDNNVKKVARYKQYFAVKKSMARVKGEDGEDKNGGVIWHTQGSGKTLTMVMLVKAIQRDKGIVNPRFLLVSDRKNLDKQMRDNFVNTSMQPVRAATGKGLVKLLENESNTVVTTIINKFETAVRQKFVNESDKIFILIDEGHRSQSGRLNTYMTHVLPNATKIAFTGTPLLGGRKNKSTYKTFGKLIDAYTIEDANEDGVIVPLVYEGRVIPQKVKSAKIDDFLKYILEPLNERQKEDLKQKWSRFVLLAQTKQRLDMVAFDLYEHFKGYCGRNKCKAMLTCSSRASAVDMYYKLKSLEGINPAVVITNNPTSEGEGDDTSSQALKKIADYFKKVEPMYGYNMEAYEDFVRGSFTDEDGEINLLIVKDKLLTGFDAPVAGVLYVDKSMRDHTLLQAIARVNRVYKNKAFGLIVDYYGVFKKLTTALDLYTDVDSGMVNFDEEDLKDVIFDPEDEKNKLKIAHEDLWEVFSGISKNETNSNVWQEHLEGEETRKAFYEKLNVYSKRVDLMFSSYDIYKSVGFDEAESYRNDLLHFTKLRAAVSLRYNDSVDFSQYEDSIVELLNSVEANDAQIVVDPLAIMDREKMNEQLDKFGTNKKAKADAMRTRMIAELETSRHDDPARYLEFSERINKTLDDYLKERDDDKYYNTIERIAEDFREGRTSIVYPHSIENDSDAKAFYVDIRKTIESSTDIELNDDILYKIAELSIIVKATILDNAKRDWRSSNIVIRKMEGAIDDNIFDFIEENNFDLDIEIIDKMIEDVLLTAKKRF